MHSRSSTVRSAVFASGSMRMKSPYFTSPVASGLLKARQASASLRLESTPTRRKEKGSEGDAGGWASGAGAADWAVWGAGGFDAGGGVAGAVAGGFVAVATGRSTESPGLPIR